MTAAPDIATLLQGNRRALARGITLVESTSPADRVASLELLQAARPHAKRALRIGISGFPGAGKSTLIEALGLRAIANGHRVAVLAIDPSSIVTGGSILGDKTRMEKLAASDFAFVRPSPTRGALGGVAGRTAEVMLLCEAAGYDVVLVETVGIGQSESAVAGITDAFVLLQLPNAGDDLQAIKRGAMELADVVVINKADLDPAAAQRAAMEVQSGSPRAAVHVVSARDSTGVAELWESMCAIAQTRRSRPVAGRTQTSTEMRPFRVLGLQQIAIGGESKARLRRLWVDLLGLEVTGSHVNERENVDEDVCIIGAGSAAVDINLMQPIDPSSKPAVQATPLNHIGLWVDDLPRAVEWLVAQGVRMAPGGIRKGAAGHDICFIHPKAGEGFAFGGEGVLIELVQAPPERDHL
jgi:LAO/AO transport system kinase